MCVPLGGRGGCSRSHSSIKTKISKNEVESIIMHNSYDVCLIKRKRCRIFRNSDMPANQLVEALNHAETTVSVANTYRTEYKRGFRTIVMKAPCIPADFIIRISNI